MKKALLLLAIACVSVTTAVAQKKEKEIRYAKLYYKNATVDGNEVSITVDNAVSTEGETKFKLKITNKTADYIIYKPEESKFIINGKEAAPKEKWLILKPNETDFRVINLKGAYNTVKSYSFVAGGLYKVTPGAEPIAAPDFKLPASQNDFTAGDFACSMTNVSKETDNTQVRFKCTYNGSKIGFIMPMKAAVRMPDGNEYANAKKNSPVLLMKGENDAFTLGWERMQGGKAMDMQKVEMTILWRNTFSEGTLTKLDALTLNLEFDEAMSNEKGKK